MNDNDTAADKSDPIADLPKRPLLRHVDPAMYVAAWNAAETVSGQEYVRESLRNIDSGRWSDVLDQAHRHIAYSDKAGRTHILEGDVYRGRFLVWVGVFGLVEDLNPFTELTGVEKE